MTIKDKNSQKINKKSNNNKTKFDEPPRKPQKTGNISYDELLQFKFDKDMEAYNFHKASEKHKRINRHLRYQIQKSNDKIYKELGKWIRNTYKINSLEEFKNKYKIVKKDKKEIKKEKENEDVEKLFNTENFNDIKK